MANNAETAAYERLIGALDRFQKRNDDIAGYIRKTTEYSPEELSNHLGDDNVLVYTIRLIKGFLLSPLLLNTAEPKL